ncbi:Hsp70 family protein [Virgisporangium aurantiacum]|uniref:Hsp70 family protein n=1 Tax=Virgisporangium aurantiacum TaxID=175570 RepID=UPI0019514CF4|nr:Hsp70 family protein [Virgisporangium aurantiacum]
MTPTVSHRLGIDFGTTHTVAYLEAADGGAVNRAQPLLFDSSPLLSSAVFADPSGRLLTGRDGDRSARLDPTRYEPNPKRRIDEAIILLGNDEFPVARVISAVLARVAAEAVRNAGGPPAQTVLTHPANWGTHRKDVLVNAAAAAGLTAVTVVPEPVAAAAHFTGVLGRTVEPGEALAVYDFGAGTFDASLVRRRPDGAWELVASEGLGDVGGLDLDAVLVELIGRVVVQRDPQRWHQLANPSDTYGRRASRTFWDDVRAAKEQLSRTPTAAVHVPLFDTDTHLTREEFEAAARPLLDRTVELTASLVGRAGPTRLAGLYLVGGSSRIPLIATLLHQRLGVAPTLIDTPELLVAQGSLRAVPAPARGPAPAYAPWGAAAAAPMGWEAPAAPVSTPPGGPVSAPSLGIPTSSIPSSGPPRPTSGAPGDPAGLPPVPSGMPLWGDTSAYGAPGLPDPTRRPAAPPRRRPIGWIVAAAAALVLLAGGGAVAAKMLTDDGDKGRDTGSNSTGTGGIQPQGGGAKVGDGGAAQTGTYKVDRAVFYQGLKVTVKTVSYDPAVKDNPLSMDVTIENLGTDGQDNVRYTEVYFTYDGAITEGDVKEVQSLPGKATTNGKFVFKPEKQVTDLRKGELSIGRDDVVQPKIPFGDLDKTVTLEPKKVAGPVDEKRSGVLGMKLNQCEQRVDYPAEHQQAKKGYMMVVCDADFKSYKQSIYDHGVWKGNLRLKLPDGTTTSPDQLNAVLLNQGDLEQGVPFNFIIRAPAPGAYVLQFYDAGRLGNEPVAADRPLVEVPMTLT